MNSGISFRWILVRIINLKSVYKENIDAFYAELKKHIDNGEVKEIPRKGAKTGRLDHIWPVK